LSTFCAEYAYDFVFADPGDRVEIDEPIAQVETDKVCVEPLLLHLL